MTPDEPERPAPPFSPTIVEDLLRQLDKTVRAHQLYMHNNPTYLKSIELLRSAFAPLWENTDSLAMQITESQLLWSGVAVLSETAKSSDSLPWTLYKDGLREITWTPGFEEQELEWFLDIIPRVRKAAAHEDDLLTLLWEQEFTKLTYRFVDISSEPGLPIDPGADAGRWPVTAGEVIADPKQAIDDARREVAADAARATGGAGGQEELKQSPSGIVNMEDFDSTLYFLDAGEVEYLRTEAVREYATDLRRTILNALLDILELQAGAETRDEVMADLEALTLHLLAGRQLDTVAHLLREIETVVSRAKELAPEVRDRLVQLPDRLSDPATLSQLLQGMDEAATLPSQEDLAALFAQLRPIALGTVFAWLQTSQNANLRPLLEAAAERLASTNTTELVKLIASSDSAVALEAVRRAAGLKTAAAVPALGKLLAEPNRDLRLAAVSALVAIGTPGAMQALDKSLEDSDRDVRVAVIRALTARAHRPALPRVTQLVRAREVREADRTERVALFELFGVICGDGGVAYLDELLNPKGGLFGRKEDPDLRACAALALGKIGTPRAQDTLQKAMGEKDIIVRTAVNRALKGGDK